MIFAVVAIFINLISQIIFEFIMKSVFTNISYNEILSFPLWFLVALGMGTIIGFIFKFIVDKYLIFNTITTMAETRAELIKYFSFAIFTTFIFWGTETSFLLLLGEGYYIAGGLVGLFIGYTLKFLFDKNYVFTKLPSNDASGI
jgi:hypothetical protein